MAKAQPKLMALDPSLVPSNDGAAGLFALLVPAGGTITKRELLQRFRAAGISEQDPRLKHTFASLAPLSENEKIGQERFTGLVHGSNFSIIERVLRQELAIPEFEAFSAGVQEIFEQAKANEEGKVASYIPQLARVNAEAFGLSFCTVDGQQASFGDDNEPFTVQSAFKPLNYAMALELHGVEKVHQHVGREPSGQRFNELTLNKRGLPHNPLINAGAIACCSLVHADWSLADRFDYVTQVWAAAAGEQKPGFNNAVYHSEKETADRNFALAHFMRENGAFPAKTDIHETLDFYFQCCSMEMTTRKLAVIAATLANSGVCPTTSKRVFSSETVKHCLSLMATSGMYDFSGEYAFTVGLPAKSGVSGVIMIVIPGVAGFAVWSPRLDELGNSVRGVDVSKELVRRYSFHHFDGVAEDSSKTDPRRRGHEVAADHTYALIWAAARGDVQEIRRLSSLGVDVTRADYDKRTALHLAAAEGHLETVQALLELGAQADAADRWQRTALSEAEMAGHEAIVTLLKKGAPAKITLADVVATTASKPQGALI